MNYLNLKYYSAFKHFKGLTGAALIACQESGIQIKVTGIRADKAIHSEIGFVGLCEGDF